MATASVCYDFSDTNDELDSGDSTTYNYTIRCSGIMKKTTNDFNAPYIPALKCGALRRAMVNGSPGTRNEACPAIATAMAI